MSELRNRVLAWANSIHDLKSDKLSSVGIDDFGDLTDEVPEMKRWMDDLFAIILKEGV